MEEVVATVNAIRQYLMNVSPLLKSVGTHLPFLVSLEMDRLDNYEQQLADWMRKQQEQAKAKQAEDVVTKADLEQRDEQLLEAIAGMLKAALGGQEDASEAPDTEIEEPDTTDNTEGEWGSAAARRAIEARHGLPPIPEDEPDPAPAAKPQPAKRRKQKQQRNTNGL